MSEAHIQPSDIELEQLKTSKAFDKLKTFKLPTFRSFPLLMLYVYPMVLTAENLQILDAKTSPVVNHNGSTTCLSGGDVLSFGHLQPVGYK